MKLISKTETQSTMTVPFETQGSNVRKAKHLEPAMVSKQADSFLNILFITQ